MASKAPFPVKHLAGPPDEFEAQRVPPPTATISEERSASQFIWFTTGLANGAVYSLDVPVDGPDEFVFSLSSPHEASLRLELLDPLGNGVDLVKNEGFIPIGDSESVPASTYIITNAIRGHYTLNLYSSLSQQEVAQLAHSSYPNVVVTVINNDYLVIESHMSSYLIKVGEEIGIISTVVDVTPQSNPGDIHVTSAVLGVITPDGKDLELPMKDTYSKLGEVPLGSYSAHFIPTLPGEYILQATLGGFLDDTTQVATIPFLRSSQLVIIVSDATVELTGTAQVRELDVSHLLIDIETTGNGNRLRAYAEVFGVDHITKEKKAVCWIGGVVEIVNNHVTLELDTNWLLLAGVSGPLTLQNVYLSDLETSFPVSIYYGEIPVVQSESIQYEKPVFPITITKEMRNGRNPLKNSRNVTAPNATPTLLLLPGYCSKTNPFQGNGFTDGAYFNAGGGNLSNDKFSLLVMDYVKAQSMTSYSIIGHSQGGMVGLHLLNYYFTGLDEAANGRLIQTVGTPWSGCTAAGDLANLGDIFGIGCGSNNDLSLDGAVNWLSGISVETRKDVHYYTTTYQQGTFFGDYCNLPINLILQWPNDGTTETKYANLVGGQNLGNKQKWCHITGMKYPAQTTDPARNTEMDQAAAR
jgi:hypothetical protein